MKDSFKKAIAGVLVALVLFAISAALLCLPTSEKSKDFSDSNSYLITQHENDSEIVYITNTGEKYHKSDCGYLKSSIPISLGEARQKGYTPCSRCW